MERRRHLGEHPPGTGRCATAREALSAAFDGEHGPLEPALLDTHLAECASCRGFAEGLAPLARRLGVGAADPAPDRADALLAVLGAAAPPDGFAGVAERARSLLRHPRWLRAGQWAAALLPLAVVLPSFALGAIAPVHVVPMHPATPCTALFLRALVRP